MVLLPIVGFAQSKKEIKNNKIKSKTIEKTEQKDGQTYTYKDSYEEFDKNGNTILRIEYSKSGEIKKKSNYKFDSFGNLIEETKYDRKNGTTITTKTKFDTNGEKLEETEIDAGGNVLQKQVYKTDDKGLRIEGKEYNADDELRWVKKYTYETY